MSTFSLPSVGPTRMLAGDVDEAFDDGVARLADRHRHAARHAALAGAAVGRRDERLHRLIQVGIGHDDEMVLRAAGRLHALAVRRAASRRCTWRSACEPTNEIAATLRMVEQRVDAFAVAVHDVEHAVRQAGFEQQLAQPHRRERHLLRRLQHERVAAGDARSGYIHSGTMNGKLYGVMPTQTPTGCRTASASTSPAMFGSDVAHDQAGDAAGELDDFDAAVHFGPGLGERLAMLARDQRGELFEVFFQQRAEAEHHPGPLDDRRLAPGRQRGGGGFDDFAGLLRRRRTARGRSPGRSTD